MKPNVMDFMFDLRVANERRSLKDTILDYLEGEERSCPYEWSQGPKPLISETQWETFIQCDAHAKEILLTCLAQTVTFNHLCSLAQKGLF